MWPCMSIELSASPLMALFYLTQGVMIIIIRLPAHCLLLISLAVTYEIQKKQGAETWLKCRCLYELGIKIHDMMETRRKALR